MDRMGTLLKKHNLKQYSSPPQKYNKCYRQQKTKGNPSPLQEYTGYLAVVTTKCSIHKRIKEHERHCRLKPPEKSAVPEYALKQAGHEILFQNTEVLDNTSNHYVRQHRKVIEKHKHYQSFNKK